MRTGPGKEDYWLAAFAWDDDEGDARWLPAGATDVRGTSHDVPRMKDCSVCHRGAPGRVLGLSALQQPDFPRELLSEPLPAYQPISDEQTAQALGYLHVNCGPCHNPTGSARP